MPMMDNGDQHRREQQAAKARETAELGGVKGRDSRADIS
jgi:hypothetical protein